MNHIRRYNSLVQESRRISISKEQYQKEQKELADIKLDIEDMCLEISDDSINVNVWTSDRYDGDHEIHIRFSTKEFSIRIGKYIDILERINDYLTDEGYSISPESINDYKSFDKLISVIKARTWLSNQEDFIYTKYPTG